VASRRKAANQKLLIPVALSNLSKLCVWIGEIRGNTAFAVLSFAEIKHDVGARFTSEWPTRSRLQ